RPPSLALSDSPIRAAVRLHRGSRLRGSVESGDTPGPVASGLPRRVTPVDDEASTSARGHHRRPVDLAPRDGDDPALTELRVRRVQLAAVTTDSRADEAARDEVDVASTAARITFVTSPGCVMSDRWPALSLVMCAPARLDISSCSAGGITRSCVPMSDHEGIVFHAGGPDGSVNCAADAGRCVAARTAASSRSTPLAKHSMKPG